MNFLLMFLQTELRLEPFITQITGKCSAFMFSHVMFIIAFNREASLTLVTPETKLSSMGLHVKAQSTVSTETFWTVGTFMQSRHGLFLVLWFQFMHVAHALVASGCWVVIHAPSYMLSGDQVQCGRPICLVWIAYLWHPHSSPWVLAFAWDESLKNMNIQFLLKSSKSFKLLPPSGLTPMQVWLFCAKGGKGENEKQGKSCYKCRVEVYG